MAGYHGTGPPAARHTSSGLSDDGHRHAVRSGAARIHEIPGGRRNRQETDSSAAASGDGCHGCHGDPGNYVVRAHTTGFEGRAAPDYRASTQSADARGSPSRGILRLQQDRDTGGANHERRGGHPQSSGHGIDRVCGRSADRSAGVGLPALPQLAVDSDRAGNRGGVRAGAAQGFRNYSAYFS